MLRRTVSNVVLPLSRCSFYASSRGYRLSAKDVKKGLVVSVKNKLWVIQDFAMHSQGRQGSHYKVELLPFGSGVAGSSSGKIVERLSPDDALEGVELLARSCRIMYESEGVIHFIDQETMEEVECTVDSLEGGETSLKMITEDMDVIIQSLEDDPSRVVSVKLPLSGVYRVQHTDPSPSMVSNEGRGTRFKPARLENGITVTVPEFIQTGEHIVVGILDCKYKERAKN